MKKVFLRSVQGSVIVVKRNETFKKRDVSRRAPSSVANDVVDVAHLKMLRSAPEESEILVACKL